MSVLDPCLIGSRRPSGQVVVRLGVPLVDDYLEFMEARWTEPGGVPAEHGAGCGL